MKDLFKYALIGVGAYFLWPYVKAWVAPGEAAPGPAPTPEIPQRTYVDVLALVKATAAAAGAAPMLNADQWNHYYQEIRGTPGFDPLEVWPGQPRERKLTAEEWWAGQSAAGLTGLTRWC